MEHSAHDLNKRKHSNESLNTANNSDDHQEASPARQKRKINGDNEHSSVAITNGNSQTTASKTVRH